MSLYGSSYYGLLAYSDGDGVVHDASATVTAASNTPNVNWEVHIGSGQLTITSTASTTCSGESFILEETDKFSYGTGLYGANDYDQADLQTIVSATSSIASVAGVRIQNGSAVSSATSTLSCLGGMRFSGAGVSTGTATFVANGVRYREGSATVTSSSTISASATATLVGSVSIVSTSSSSANAEKFFLESSDKFAYGSGLYGMNAYDEADLQTIVSATSVSSTCSGEKINLGSAVSSAVASNTVIAEKINLGSGSMTSVAVGTASSVFVASASASITTTSSIANVSWIRERNSSAIVSLTSGTATIAREKWEVIAPTSTTWTEIAA